MKKLIALGLVALLSIGATINPDSYDKLFCKANGTTTTFVDSSTANPKTITANGNATQLSLHADFAGRRTAGFFNGTTDYVVVPTSTDFSFGTGDYEYGFYVNFNKATDSQCILDMGSEAIAVFYNGSNTLGIYEAGSARTSSTPWTPTVGTWYKIKVARVSGTLTLYIDDVAQGTPYSSSNSITGAQIIIGDQTALTTKFSGWIKNFYIKKAGTTVLDMKFDTPATSPLGPVIYFDGTGDYLTAPDSNDWDFGTGDFTLEQWVRFEGTPSGTFFDVGDGTGGVGVWFGVTAANVLYVYVNTAEVLANSWTPTSNSWYHVACVRASGVLKTYVNGKQIGSVANTTNITGSTATCKIGRRADAVYLTGHVREARISNTARYTAAFTPSQTGFTVDSNTKLYIKGDENNGVTTFVDSETTPKTVTTAGDTKIKYTEDYRSCIFKDDSASAHKPYPVGSAKVDFFSAFGSGVGYFAASGDNLTIPDSADWDASASDPLTVECYFRLSTIGTSIFIGRDAYTTVQMTLQYHAGNFGFYLNNAVKGELAFTPIANTWYHLAGVKESNAADKCKIYLNGIVGATTGTDNTGLAGSKGIRISGRPIDNFGYIVGLLDNIRISKGVARYTATFNPPADFPQTGSKRKKASDWWWFF